MTRIFLGKLFKMDDSCSEIRAAALELKALCRAVELFYLGLLAARGVPQIVLLL